MILMNLLAALLPKSFCFRVLTLFLEKSFPGDTWILQSFSINSLQ
jgi:hypothetical protein